MHLNTVSASTGLQWIRNSLRIVMRRTLPLLGSLLFGLIPLLVFSGIPRIGQFIVAMLLPALSLGMFTCIHAAHRDFPLGPPQLLAAFTAGAKVQQKILTLGAIYAVCDLLILLLCSVIDPEGFAHLFFPSSAQQPITANTMESLMQSSSFFIALLLFVMFSAVLSTLFSLAAAQAHWYQQPVHKALFFSAICCKHNAAALLTYIGLWFALAFGISIGLALLRGILGTLGGMGMALNFLLFNIAILFVVTIGFGAQYFAFLDCFRPSSTERT